MTICVDWNLQSDGTEMRRTALGAFTVARR